MRALVLTNSITSREEKSLEKYLNEISRYGVLTPEEEVRVFRKYKNGDHAAHLKLVRSNLRFVVSVAKQYQHCGLSLGDLINEGNLGLIKAIKRFDETRGFKFISYAVWWIRQSILNALGEKGRKIRLPLNHQSSTRTVLDHQRALSQTLNRLPTAAEIAAASGLSERLVKKCLITYKHCRSLDAPLAGEEDSTLHYLLEDSVFPAPDQKVAVKESLEKETQELLRNLNFREAEVVSMYFGIQQPKRYSLQDISDYIGVSRERVRQIKDRSIQKLRKLVTRKELIFSIT